MRLDLLLSQKQGISRTRAGNLIKTGGVKVNGCVADKPSLEVQANDDIIVTDTLKFVSLGGIKLENALLRLDVAVKDAVCLDVGAANGGFTDCLLKSGAKEVSAVDLTIAFPKELLQDERITIYDNVNVRDIPVVLQGMHFDFICADLSFISLTVVFPLLYPLLKSGGKAVVLFKPQFEVGRKALPKSGVVRDEKTIERAFLHCKQAAEDAGFRFGGFCYVPDVFPNKNKERTILLVK